MNTIGRYLRVSVVGGSHASHVGCIVDGIPPGIKIQYEEIERLILLRKPVAGLGTSRVEEDRPEIISGVKDGYTDGTPITILIRNSDIDSRPYIRLKDTPRPGHADYTAYLKYGERRDFRGGGIFSGRMTAPIVVAGGIAEGVLHLRGIRVVAHASCIGGVHAPEIRYEKLNSEDLKKLKDRIAGSRVRCHDRRASELMEKVILQVKKGKDSIGGTVSCAIIGVPGGIGDPFFDTIEGEISKWMFSIPGIKSVAFGSGSECPAMRGSEFNDPFEVKNGRIITSTNHSGGVLGGITTGMPIVFHVNVRPTSSIGIPQKSVNLKTKSPAIIRITGRHDPCIVPRAVPVVEACASLCILDTLLSAGYKFTGE